MRRFITAIAAASALPLAVLAAPPASAAGRHLLPDTQPSWATAANDTGSVAATKAQTVRVYLAGADPAGLAAYAAGVAEPGSPYYQHYLTPAQFQARFGATSGQVGAVTSWLAGAGLRVTATTAHYVQATGSTANTRTAFGTDVHSYRTSTGVQQAPTSGVSVPESVAPDVLTVQGLTGSAAKFATDVTSTPVNVGTCSEYAGQKQATNLPPAYGHTLNWDECGYVPSQLRSAYGVSGSRLDGRGVTVAVVDQAADPTLEQDLNTYSQAHGLPAMRPGQYSENLPADINTSCPPENAYIEQSLDVEAVHTMAPAANIVYVGTDCTALTDALDAEARIVDGHLADIVSDSWHLGIESQMPPDLVTSFEQVFEQGAVEGIGFYYSSGDHGDWSPFTPNHTTAVQYPGSDPWVTSVGGTTLAVGRDNRYQWETGWGSPDATLSSDGTSWVGLPGSFDGGAGGGASALFTQPAYQRGVVPASLAGGMRVMPDIAADADDTSGMLIGLTATLTPGGSPQYVEGKVGGTSLATPLIAGIQADAQQARGGVPIGFADPAIYARYGGPAYRDVTDHPFGPGSTLAVADEERDPGSGALQDFARTLGEDTSLTANRGYDDVTGVGSPTQFYLDTYRTH